MAKHENKKLIIFATLSTIASTCFAILVLMFNHIDISSKVFFTSVTSGLFYGLALPIFVNLFVNRAKYSKKIVPVLCSLIIAILFIAYFISLENLRIYKSGSNLLTIALSIIMGWFTFESLKFALINFKKTTSVK